MKPLLTLTVLTFSLIAAGDVSRAADRLEMDFSQGMSGWNVVVDGVMGGLSTGFITREQPGVLRFTGELSLANNGGFSQIRTSVDGERLTGARGIELTVRGDGREYGFDVRTSNARVMAGGFQKSFRTEDGAWMTVRLPFSDFRLYTFGRLIRDAPTITPELIESIGLTLSDKNEGPFRLEIDSIRTFDDDAQSAAPKVTTIATLSRASGSNTLSRLVEAAAPERPADGSITAISRESGLNTLRELIAADDSGPSSDRPAARSVSASSVMEAARLCELAIHRGVPLFNAGQTSACAAIYEVTIEAMVALGTDDLGAGVIDRLRQGLAQAEATPDSRERAWIFRRTLDVAYAHLTRPAA